MLDIWTWIGFSPLARAHVTFNGHAYEGGFHFAVERRARLTGVKGWMRSMRMPMYEYVELEVEGRKGKIERLISQLREMKNAKITSVDLQWRPYTGQYREFRVRL